MSRLKYQILEYLLERKVKKYVYKLNCDNKLLITAVIYGIDIL